MLDKNVRQEYLKRMIEYILEKDIRRYITGNI